MEARRIEFGDFQTPLPLAREVCSVLRARGVAPAALVEPTCGRGHFVVAGLEVFPEVRQGVASDVNEAYLDVLRTALAQRGWSGRVRIEHRDAFTQDWTALLRTLPGPVLLLGNPPWVTSAALGRISGQNGPTRANTQGLTGLDALTGKSNFDVSEWLLGHLANCAHEQGATLAFLCKLSVARKVLNRHWSEATHPLRSAIYLLDAKAHFDASVAACLLVLEPPAVSGEPSCEMYPSLSASKPSTSFGLVDGQLVANAPEYRIWRHLRGTTPVKWRSGVKHDCARVMELDLTDGRLRNGFGAACDLEAKHVFPLLKSSDLAKGRVRTNRRVIVTQFAIGQDTRAMSVEVPKTWAYLQEHASLLDGRKSSVYRGKPRFSIFGVGPYTLAPWKVAVSGLYKRVRFNVVGPVEGRPVVFDDTCCFVPCASEGEAHLIAELCNSESVAKLLDALVFWDEKRPVTIGMLNTIDLLNVARTLNRNEELARHLAANPYAEHTADLFASQPAT